MGFLYFIVCTLLPRSLHRAQLEHPHAMLGEDTHLGLNCCQKHPKKCNAHKRMCNAVDVGYQSKLLRFNRLVGKMNAEAHTMRSVTRSAHKICGSYSIPK